MKFIKFFINILFWLRIFIAPFLVFLILSYFAYHYFNSTIRTEITILIVIIGALISALITRRVRKKYGTISFMSRVIATPELDKVDK